MKKIILLIGLWICAKACFAQSYEQVLREIEQNNTHLQLLRAEADAQKLECRKDIHLENPEVDFGYLWGTPMETGNRVDLNVTQGFDFPSVYYYKKKIAEGKVAQAELSYETERRTLLADARKLCIRLIYYNIMRDEFEHHIEVGKAIQEIYQKMFDAGETSILELNKAKLNLLSAYKEYESNKIVRDNTLAELVLLNGGKAIQLDDTLYPEATLPSNFNEWYRSIESAYPELQRLELQQEIARREVQLEKSYWAPHFNVGYKSERILGTTLQGVGVGVELPLWQNRYAVRSAQAQTIALQSAIVDTQTSYYSTLQSKYNQALSLQELSLNYRQILLSVSVEELLMKALEQGEITLLEYIMEYNVYHEAMHNAIEAERNLQIAIIELKAYAE